MKVTKKPKKVKKPVSKTTKAPKKSMKKKTKKVVSIAKGIDIVEKADGTYVIAGKNAKAFNGAVVERKERQYKFDDRLVPYYLGGDSKDGNLKLREALVKLGKTPEMTELFIAMKQGNLGYREDAKETFIKALFTIIKGHDEVGLAHVYEEDIQAIHDNNFRVFSEFWDPPRDEDEYGLIN